MLGGVVPKIAQFVTGFPKDVIISIMHNNAIFSETTKRIRCVVLISRATFFTNGVIKKTCINLFSCTRAALLVDEDKMKRLQS